VAWCGSTFADQEDVVPPAGDRPADELLGGAVAVHLGGVDQRQADVDARAKGVQLDVVPVGVLTQVPGAHAEGRGGAVGQGDGAHRECGHAGLSTGSPADFARQAATPRPPGPTVGT
jgi:hypothetical protein